MKKIKHDIQNKKQNKELERLIKLAKTKAYKIRNVGIDDYGKFHLVIS